MVEREDPKGHVEVDEQGFAFLRVDRKPIEEKVEQSKSKRVAGRKKLLKNVL